MGKLARTCSLLAALGLLAGAGEARAQFVVSNTNDSGAGSLRQAILDANLQNSTNQTITFSSAVMVGDTVITLQDPLPTIDVGDGTLTIDGEIDDGDPMTTIRAIVDGADAYRIFFVESGNVTIQRFSVRNGLGQGGDGGNRGGGGLGAGGGLFVDDGADVTVEAVFFDDNAAVGGAGGSGGAGGGAGGGGGGLLGDGGSGNGGAGGGGGLLDDPDVPGANADGGDGNAVSGGDGGGNRNGSDTGGAGGPIGGQPSPALPFGGGGGAGPTGLGGLGVGGGDGGQFGGGGGGTGAGEGGDGGFGGGGGGTSSGTAGSGGFGGGDGGTGAAASAGGGGGDGLGGAVFVREGGQLTIVGGGVGTALANTSTAGLGADGGADGEASGGGLYLMSNVDLTVEVDTGNTVNIESAIGGDGGLIKTGAGNLLLTSGGNDYSGDTTIQEGKIIGRSSAIQGRFVLATTNSTLAFEEAAAVTGEVTAFISGAGRVQKDGQGTVILNPTGGSNEWNGGTNVLTGTLQASAGALPPTNDVAVQSGATLVLNEAAPSDDATWAGNLVGPGEFRKTGPGTSRLTGSNSFTGTFTVEEGTLRGNAGSLPSATPIRIQDATLVFDQASNATFSGTLQSVAVGQGVVEKAGGGALTLDTSQPTFTGDTVVSAGTLLLTESLGAAGSGAQASVNGGALIVNGNGALFADTTVAAGARLEGNASGAGDGLIGDLVLNGTLAPGSSVGTLRVDGDATFGAASVYELEYDLTGTTADLLEVTGSAAVDGELAIRLLGAGRGGPVAIVTAAGGRTGCFDSIVNQPGFFTFALDCDPGPGDPNAVILDIAFDDTARFADFAITGNQTAVGNALDPPPDPDDAPFTDPWDEARAELFKIPGQLPAVYDELGGEAHTAFTTAQLANAQEVGRVISARLRQVGGRSVGGPGTVDFLISGSRGDPRSRLAELGGALLASNDASHALSLAAAGPAFGMMPPPEGRRFGFWVDGYGTFGNLDGSTNSSATSWWSAGVLAGFDLILREHGLLGLTGGWSRVTPDLDDRNLDGKADVFQGGLYGAYVSERIYVGGLARYAYSDFDTDRKLRFAGTDLAGNASASYNGHEAGGFVELGYVALAPDAWQIEPMVAGHFNWLLREGFRESGSDALIDALSLDVEQETWTSIVTAVGVRVHKRFSLDEDLSIQPEVWGAWAHEFGDRDRPLEARFKGAGPGAGRFRVLGATAARDGGQFGAGWSVSRNDLTLFFYYDGNANADLIANGFTAGVLIRW